MANRNHLSPKSIVDKNGKRTTVHVANSVGSSSPDAAKRARERQDAAIAEAARRAAGPVAVLETPKRDERGFDAVGVHGVTGTRFDSDGFDAGGWNAEGVHRETGNRFGPHGIDSRGFTELGDNFFTDHGTYDTNGYDFDGWNAQGQHMKTLALWDDGGLLRDGQSATGLLNSKLQNAPDSRAHELSYDAELVGGELVITITATPRVEDNDVWTAIGDPDMMGIEYAFDGLRELGDEKAKSIATALNDEAEEAVGGLTESDDEVIDDTLGAVWSAFYGDEYDEYELAPKPSHVHVEYKRLPIDLVEAKHVLKAWNERLESEDEQD